MIYSRYTNTKGMRKMENALTILGLISAVALAGSIVWLIISLVKKQPCKKPLLTIGGTLAAFLVLMYSLGSYVQDNALESAGNNTVASSSPDTEYETEHTSLGDLTLVKEIFPEDTFTQDVFNTTVNNIKIYKVENPEPSFKEDIANYSGREIGDTIYYMTIYFEGENASLGDIEWYGLASVTLDDGTWYNQEDDDMLVGQDENGIDITPYYSGEESKEYVQMYILDNPDVNSVDLEFDVVSDGVSGTVIAPGKTVTYEFN